MAKQLTNIITSRIPMTFAESVGKNKFVNYDGEICGLGERAAGVTEDAYNEGDSGSLVTAEVILMKAAGILGVGDPVTSSANGDAIITVDLDTNIANGIAMAGATTNDFTLIHLKI